MNDPKHKEKIDFHGGIIMNEDLDFTLNELLDEAKDDAVWEPDEKRRAEIVELFKKITSSNFY